MSESRQLIWDKNIFRVDWICLKNVEPPLARSKGMITVQSCFPQLSLPFNGFEDLPCRLGTSWSKVMAAGTRFGPSESWMPCNETNDNEKTMQNKSLLCRWGLAKSYNSSYKIIQNQHISGGASCGLSMTFHYVSSPEATPTVDLPWCHAGSP